MTIEKAFSKERLARYRAWGKGDDDKAQALYALNIAISESFYTPLNILEIVVRNSIHDRMVTCYGSNWFSNSDVITNDYQKMKVQAVYKKFKNKTTKATDGQIVAELTFGFWTAMFNANNNHFWGRALRPIFSSDVALQRKPIARRLNTTRNLRNRIAHHEPIIQRSLNEEYQIICELIGWLSPEALIWCNARSRFYDIYPKQSIIIGELVNPSLSLQLKDN